jgi:hypothetical protein
VLCYYAKILREEKGKAALGFASIASDPITDGGREKRLSSSRTAVEEETAIRAF